MQKIIINNYYTLNNNAQSPEMKHSSKNALEINTVVDFTHQPRIVQADEKDVVLKRRSTRIFTRSTHTHINYIGYRFYTEFPLVILGVTGLHNVFTLISNILSFYIAVFTALTKRKDEVEGMNSKVINKITERLSDKSVSSSCYSTGFY
jgi:hypothetical protein